MYPQISRSDIDLLYILSDCMFLKKLINKGYEAEQCEICNNPFKLIKLDRIHKCKRCLKFICLNCGDAKEFVIDEEGKMSLEKHRVCVNCRADIQLIKQNMEHYRLKWAQDSTLAQQWLANLNKIHPQKFQYEHFLALYFHSGSKFNEQTEIIDKDVIRGRTDFSVFNYSMKEFFYTVQLGVQDQHSTRLNIANVLYGVAARFEKVGYCQGMSGIAAFLLCFASQQSAFAIFCDLLQYIFPHMFFQRSNCGVALIGLLAEIHFLKEYFQRVVIEGKKNLLLKERKAYSEEERAHIKMIIQLAGSKALLSVFIGILNFSNLMFVWEELKNRRSFQVVERAFLAIIYLNRNAILQERSFKKLEEYFEKLDCEAFRQAYHDIQIDQEVRRSFLEDFHVQNNKKWNSAAAGNPYTLSKVTSLSEPEIKALQKAFCQGFTPLQVVEQPIMDEGEFVFLVEAYYRILKQESEEGESILQISSFFLKKILRTYLQEGRTGLAFRQFVCCFSMCTKSSLKDRVCAILGTFKDYSCRVALQNFNKLMDGLLQLAPPALQLKKAAFQERVRQFFAPDGKVSLYQLEILLSDEFMLEMSLFIVFEVPDIVNKTIEAFKQEKTARESSNGIKEAPSEAEKTN